MRTRISRIMLVSAFCLTTQAADFYFGDTSAALNQTSSWIGGVKPVDPLTDIAVFSSNTVARSPNLGSTYTDKWLGMVITNSSFKWTVTQTSSGVKTLSIGSAGINLAGSNGADVEIQSRVTLLTNQIWNVTDSARTLTVGSSTNPVSGAFSITKSGAGTLVLGATNTFSGGLTINGGIVNAAVSDALGAGTVTMNDGSELSSSGKTVTNTIVIGAGNISVYGDITLAGTLSGPGRIKHSGSNTVAVFNLTGNNSGFTGGITNNAAVSAGHRNALGTGTITLNNLSSLSAGITLTGTNALNNNIVLNGAATLSGSFDLDLSGTVSGIGSLTKAGSGMLTLSGANSYTGGTVVSNGVLVGKASGCFGSRFVKVLSGATLTLTNSANCIGDSAKLILNASSMLNLNFIGTDTVGGISLNGGVTWLPAGTYNAAALGASGSGSLTVGSSASVLLSDSFSGTTGAPLSGSTLDTGGSWSKMTGEFMFANGGGIVASNNSGAGTYTEFNMSSNVNSITDGIVVSATFAANGYSGLSFSLGLVETINAGHFQNLNSDDAIRFIYYVGGDNAGTFKWGVYDEGVVLNTDSSVRAGTETIHSNDLIRLSLTCYPKFGLVFGEATNLTQGYLISSSRIGVNTPGLTNTLYAGMGFAYPAVTNPADPAVVSSFSVTTAPDLTSSRPLLLAADHPPTMTGFAFQDMTNGVATTNFPYVLSEHAPIDILHAVRDNVYDTVRATYPDKIMIRQMAWGGSAGITLDAFWPGHCLLKLGTKVTNDCAAVTNDTVLYMQDYTRIVASQAKIDTADNSAKYAVLYALDANGKPDWSRAEHVKMVSIDTNTGALTVQRGQLGTSPQAITNGQAVIARHMMFWTSQWQANLSLESPRGGPFNMTASEWFAVQIAQQIYIKQADGVEFDVARWQWGFPAANPMDCDNDLVADYGCINGINSFGLGGQVMVRKLRELVGPDKIIQADSNDALFGQRGWKYMNGVQMESFPQGNHFGNFSEAFFHLRQWVSRVEPSPAFSYPFSKTTSSLFGNVFETNGASVDWHFRVGFATALLAGMPHPFASITDINFDPANPEVNSPDLVEDKGFYKWDEYVGGELNDWKWLGTPQGTAVQFPATGGNPDLLASTVWQWKTETNFSASCSISNGEYAATITALPSNTLPWASAYYPSSQVPQALWFGTRLEIASGAPSLTTNQEYTLEFEAKGNDSWDVAGQVFEKVPRSLVINGLEAMDYHKAASVFLNADWTRYRFTIISDSNTPPPLIFGVSEQVGTASIRNIHLYQGSDERWTREFANGRVYLNMTKIPWTVNVDTGVVQRIVGSQIPALNNGAVVNGTLTVPAWDAVFLRTWTLDAWRTAQFGLDVSDDFSISFDGRAAGDPLVGFDVQTGRGTWANVYTVDTGSLGGDMKFVSGGGLTETVGAGGGVYIPLAGLGETFSMEVVVTPKDFAAGGFTIGFFDTVNRGYLVNQNSNDVLRIRYIQSAGTFQFGVYNDGVASNTSTSVRTGGQTLNAADAVRLTLSYNTTNGDITGTAYDVTGGYELSTKTINVPGLTNMQNAGFGWSSIPNQTPTPSVNPGVVSSFKVSNTPLAIMNASISDDAADPDGDGFSNTQEYIAGTDPLNGMSQFVVGGGLNSARKIQMNWSSVSGRVYDVYWSTNLMSSFVPLQTNISWPQAAYTSPVPGDAGSGFYKIKVRRR